MLATAFSFYTCAQRLSKSFCQSVATCIVQCCLQVLTTISRNSFCQLFCSDRYCDTLWLATVATMWFVHNCTALPCTTLLCSCCAVLFLFCNLPCLCSVACSVSGLWTVVCLVCAPCTVYNIGYACRVQLTLRIGWGRLLKGMRACPEGQHGPAPQPQACRQAQQPSCLPGVLQQLQTRCQRRYCVLQ